MPESSPVIVLKFGGSLLLDDHRLRIAVHEIYRWRREGWRVLAVVSALAGRTEELIARCDAMSTSISPHARAGVIGLGERESAGLLGVHLDRAGIPATVLTPDAVGLCAHGHALDATPDSVNTRVLSDALDEHGVVVFPGFIAIDKSGTSVTFGRGGSDLTAVYLAHKLGADTCRLIKDVDGLYEFDPATSDAAPRFAHASYEDALGTDGSIIQHKAVQYAQQHGIGFELGRFNGVNPTTIGPEASKVAEQRDYPIKLSLVICGLGVVGGGVLELVRQLPEHFEVQGCARRTIRSVDFALGIQITDDPVSLASQGADVVIELIGGTDTAWEIAQTALNAGSTLVTANKALIAEHGDRLESLASVHGQPALASASVGGVTPVLEAIRGREVLSIEGVLNGTGNFVLGALEEGSSLNQAIREAQRLGFAESDPSRDLDGRDTLDKLLVMAQTQYWAIPHDRRRNAGISGWADGARARYPARQVAYVDQTGAQVVVEPVEGDSVFEQLRNEWNAAIIRYADGTEVTVRGKGAGRWPTSEAVLADLLELGRSRSIVHARKEACHA